MSRASTRPGLLEHLHEQIRAALPGYRLLDLKGKFVGRRVNVEGPPGNGSILGNLIAPAEA